MSREFPCVFYLNGKCKRYEEVGVMSWCSGDLKCGGRKPSRGDTIRAMEDLELAMHLVRLVDADTGIRYCRDLEKCGEDLNADREIPLERCAGCMLKWLQEAEPEMTAGREGLGRRGSLGDMPDDRESCGLIEEG